MTIPINTVKHVRTAYRKYQLLTIVCTLITLCAAIFAAITGIQLVRLQKQKDQAAVQVQATAQHAEMVDTLQKQIQGLQSELAREKEASQKLKTQMTALYNQINAFRNPDSDTQTANPQADAPQPAPSQTQN